MKSTRLSWTALSLACLTPFLAATPQDAAKAVRIKKLGNANQEKVQDKKELTPAQQDYQRLMAEARQARTDHFKKLREKMMKDRAEGNQPRTMAIRMGAVDLSYLTPKFLECATKYAGTDDAIQFLSYTLQITKDKDRQNQVLETLEKDHLKSDKLVGFVLSLSRLRRQLGKDRCEVIMASMAKSPNKAVQSAVHYTRASTALRDRKISDVDRAIAHKQLVIALELAPDASFASKARGALYEANSLQVGMKSPDISGKDTDGVAFKLSDYKGKVILLDFWGDW